jgi:ribosomal protein S18 acetylase RimI-like enzyme
MRTGPKEALREGSARTLLFAAYVDYYLEHEPHNCFVAADDEDKAVGFILCAEDYRPYREIFMRDYAPRTKGFSLPMRVECLGAAILPKFFRKRYPAHLHINILPEYQRMGLGGKLMDALTAQLRAKGVPGVMLGVGSKNERGKNFYGKYGFKKLLRIPFSTAMGLRLR